MKCLKLQTITLKKAPQIIKQRILLVKSSKFFLSQNASKFIKLYFSLHFLI